ncbi:MAG: hypothetical protein KDD04_07570, partial [Sinomicrobium sp.]|nr:hypothetical protein [Sinomicrobium sp.]
MPVNKRRHFSLRTVALFTCIVFSFTSVTEAAVNTAFNTQSSVLIPQSSSLIPSEYGRVEKYHQGTSDKTIIYIKDAHDSIEAQENIANMIHYLVEHQNVQTVYEEGYEGSVPSDKYFGSVEDPAVKKEVSYYLMDRLKIGGAEYAPINRTKDFYLIGADSRELHFENIRWYQKNTELSEETDRDLKQIYKELKRLASRHLPSPVRKWLKYKNRLDRQAMDLSDYLKRTFEFLGLPTSQIMTPV